MIRRAMSDDWRAAAFYLERTDPKRWGRRTSHELQGPEGGPIQLDEPRTDLSRLSDDQLDQLDQLLREASPDERRSG